VRVPEQFEERLEREFRGRLRLRWSPQRYAWLIEQKVGRGRFPGTKPARTGWDETSDRYVQHRDGYVELLEVRVGTKMDCPRCHTELSVPFNETKAITCEYCKLRGHSPHIAAMFVPLIAFNALYAWARGEGQSSCSYLIGTQTKGEKLGAFRLDLGPRIFRHLAAREYELRLRK